MMFDLFATCPKGLESVLVPELEVLGGSEVRQTRAGAAFRGDLKTAYRACLWSRVANRILLRLTAFPVASPEDLYDGVRQVPWGDHLSPTETLAVDCNLAANAVLTHSRYAALTTKDAIVDQLRDETGSRPSVDVRRPDVRLNVAVFRDRATVSLDLSGESLHRRGYRHTPTKAPLKQNTAAGLLLRVGWPRLAREGGAFVDPMGGSGTLAIEAAWIAGDVAPGLGRERYGFEGWRGHDPALWQSLLDEARERRDQALPYVPPMTVYDADPRAVRACRANLREAGLEGLVLVEQRDVSQARPPAGATAGLVAVNPPYGERLGHDADLGPVYEALGSCFKNHFTGWEATVLTGRPDLGKRMGLRARKVYRLFNGEIPCSLLSFEVAPRWFVDPARNRIPKLGAPVRQTPAAEPFANRLAKNAKRLGRWARRNGITCYRVYDADMPEYAVAVDRYEGWVHVQEYAPPVTVDPARAEERLKGVMAEVPRILDVPPDHVFLKVRRRQRGADQYRSADGGGGFYEVAEGGHRFFVNFTDHLDTGLFLDHRPTRGWLGAHADGKSFLNLFCYTGAATVYAGVGGAVRTVGVDLSAPYLDWARRNLDLNGVSGDHRFIRADVLTWINGCTDRFDLIFLDPPTFSNSKRMDQPFEVDRDHPGLIRRVTDLLAPGATLVFSNNFRKFSMDPEILEDYRVEDWSRKTLPEDFKRNPKIHNCWAIRQREGS